MRTAYELMTGHNVKHGGYSFEQKVRGMWYKNIKNDHNSKWFEAYCMGIITNCGSYLFATRDLMYKVSTIKAKTENESFSAQILEEVAMNHQQSCSEEVSSKKHVA